MENETENHTLSLPSARCLSKQQAAQYLGIGVTLLTQIGPLPIKLGRRCLYDVVDLDAWLDDYKSRGRARKEVLWPVKKDSIDVKTRPTGGLIQSSQMDAEYAKALGVES
ncbi:MAG: hypothetical protein ABW090_09235 [Sedimenticola sp.]